jgi:phage repressor protein C with HTH and peptisase S24 domain
MTTIQVKASAIPRTPCFGVPVSGDSMEPRYRDGDLLIVSVEPVNVGEIGIFTLDGMGYVKQLGSGILHSLNGAYEDIPLTEEAVCNGKVVGVLDPADIIEE